MLDEAVTSSSKTNTSRNDESFISDTSTERRKNKKYKLIDCKSETINLE